MRLYETVFIIRQDTSAQDVQIVADTFVSLLKDMDAKLVKREYWGLRVLAYPIKKNKRGHYVMLGLQASPDAIKELERRYRISETIIRFITLQVDHIDEKPSLMMKAAAEEEEKTSSYHNNKPSYHSKDLKDNARPQQ